jgi:hypothetical protein
MVTADELLAAVRSAGEPGSESHREACRLYRRSVLERQAGTRQCQRDQAVRAALYLLTALLATAAIDAGWFDHTGCGTHEGYNKHAYDKTPACTDCEDGERVYSREAKRAQKRARTERQQALQVAA